VAQSASPRAAQRLREAALAGGWFGLMQGALFWIVVPRLGEVKFNEQVSATLLSLAMIGAGVLAGAGLAVFTAHQVERRRQAA
jgi:hypothetical protein